MHVHSTRIAAIEANPAHLPEILAILDRGATPDQELQVERFAGAWASDGSRMDPESARWQRRAIAAFAADNGSATMRSAAHGLYRSRPLPLSETLEIDLAARLREQSRAAWLRILDVERAN